MFLKIQEFPEDRMATPESLLAKTSIGTISRSPRQPANGSTETELVVREWLARFATNAGQPLTETRVIMWLDEFAGIDPDLLSRAFRAVLREHVFSNVPTIGQVYQEIDKLRDAEATASTYKELPAPAPWEQLHEQGFEYCRRMAEWTRTLFALRKKFEVAPKADPVVYATPDRLAELTNQKEAILRRFSQPS